jgi:hypothetical protein
MTDPIRARAAQHAAGRALAVYGPTDPVPRALLATAGSAAARAYATRYPVCPFTRRHTHQPCAQPPAAAVRTHGNTPAPG